MLKSPIALGSALIIVEKDDAILDYFIHDIKSYSDKINIEVKNTYYPNYYIRGNNREFNKDHQNIVETLFSGLKGSG
jgi:hypothetical protein